MKRFGEEKKVYSFLNGLNEYEQILLGHLFDFSRQVRKIVKTYEISKKELCAAVHIEQREYKKFIAGGFNYSLKHMVCMEHLYRKKVKEAAEKLKIVTVAKEKNDTK